MTGSDTSTSTATGHRNTRYLLGHQILRHSGRGCRWFTIDAGERRFESAQAAIAFIRSLEPRPSHLSAVQI